MARALKPTAEPILDGVAAMVQRAADRLRTASAYANTSGIVSADWVITGAQRFDEARRLLTESSALLDEIERAHLEER